MSRQAATQFREGLNADQELREGMALALAAKLPVQLDELLSAEALNAMVEYAASQGYLFTVQEAVAEYTTLLQAQKSEPGTSLSDS